MNEPALTPEQIEALTSIVPDESGSPVSKQEVWEMHNDVIERKTISSKPTTITEQPENP